MRHLLEIDDLTAEEIDRILSLATSVEAPRVLAGKGAALIFEKPQNPKTPKPHLVLIG